MTDGDGDGDGETKIENERKRERDTLARKWLLTQDEGKNVARCIK